MRKNQSQDTVPASARVPRVDRCLGSWILSSSRSHGSGMVGGERSFKDGLTLVLGKSGIEEEIKEAEKASNQARAARTAVRAFVSAVVGGRND